MAAREVSAVHFLHQPSTPKGLSSIGIGCPGKGLSHHPWRSLEDVQTWHFRTWFSGWLGSVRFMVRLNDLRGLFQPKQFYDFKQKQLRGEPGSHHKLDLQLHYRNC